MEKLTYEDLTTVKITNVELGKFRYTDEGTGRVMEIADPLTKTLTFEYEMYGELITGIKHLRNGDRQKNTITEPSVEHEEKLQKNLDTLGYVPGELTFDNLESIIGETVEFKIAEVPNENGGFSLRYYFPGTFFEGDELYTYYQQSSKVSEVYKLHDSRQAPVVYILEIKKLVFTPDQFAIVVIGEKGKTFLIKQSLKNWNAAANKFTGTVIDSKIAAVAQRCKELFDYSYSELKNNEELRDSFIGRKLDCVLEQTNTGILYFADLRMIKDGEVPLKVEYIEFVEEEDIEDEVEVLPTKAPAKATKTPPKRVVVEEEDEVEEAEVVKAPKTLTKAPTKATKVVVDDEDIEVEVLPTKAPTKATKTAPKKATKVMSVEEADVAFPKTINKLNMVDIKDDEGNDVTISLNDYDAQDIVLEENESFILTGADGDYDLIIKYTNEAGQVKFKSKTTR